jgi:hypothetical protein
VIDRCEQVTGSFFEQVPGGADAYLLKSVIHDWDDERSTAILYETAERPSEGEAGAPGYAARAPAMDRLPPDDKRKSEADTPAQERIRQPILMVDHPDR